eukprot:4480835-Pleurochrysis_carterae.AAC.1
MRAAGSRARCMDDTRNEGSWESEEKLEGAGRGGKIKERGERTKMRNTRRGHMLAELLGETWKKQKIGAKRGNGERETQGASDRGRCACKQREGRKAREGEGTGPERGEGRRAARSSRRKLRRLALSPAEAEVQNAEGGVVLESLREGARASAANPVRVRTFTKHSAQDVSVCASSV